MQKIVNLKEVKEENRQYTKQCAEWVITTLQEVIKTEQGIIEDMEGMIEDYSYIGQLEKEGATDKLTHSKKFEEDSIDYVYRMIKAVSGITNLLAQYDLMQKVEYITNKRNREND